MIIETPEECGMLDLTSFPARCTRGYCGNPDEVECGWQGVPTYVRGVPQTQCPNCEGFGNELDLRERPLRWDVRVRERIQYVAVAKQRRNDPCSCGSGKKFKKCCGA